MHRLRFEEFTNRAERKRKNRGTEAKPQTSSKELVAYPCRIRFVTPKSQERDL